MRQPDRLPRRHQPFDLDQACSLAATIAEQYPFRTEVRRIGAGKARVDVYPAEADMEMLVCLYCYADWEKYLGRVWTCEPLF